MARALTYLVLLAGAHQLQDEHPGHHDEHEREGAKDRPGQAGAGGTTGAGDPREDGDPHVLVLRSAAEQDR